MIPFLLVLLEETEGLVVAAVEDGTPGQQGAMEECGEGGDLLARVVGGLADKAAGAQGLGVQFLLFKAGSVQMVNCTIVQNQATGGSPGGHGVAAFYNHWRIQSWSSTQSSLPTRQLATLDVYGAFASEGYNFIGNSSGSSGWSPVTDYQNRLRCRSALYRTTVARHFTCAVLPGSLCILAGTSVGAPPTDERGVIRPLGKCDIGAYQYTTLIQTIVTWTNPASIVYSTPLSAVQLNATANAGGMFTYIPPAGSVLNAGSNQVLTAIFTPSDPTSYTDATNTVLIHGTEDKPSPQFSDHPASDGERAADFA